MMTTHHLKTTWLAIATASSLTGLPAQEQPSIAPATEPPQATKSTENGVPNREALILRVNKAHQPDGKIAKIDAFTSKIELELKDVTADKGGQVTLDVSYLDLHNPKRKRPTTLLRYAVKGGEDRIVRGFDVFGPWHLRNGKPEDLTAPNAVQDLANFQEHRSLAQQLVRFLSPGDVIQSLTNCSAVEEREIVLSRRKATKALAIEGDAERFPMMHNAGEEQPARLTVWVDAKTNKLLAVDVTPIVNDKPQPDRRERIKLSKLTERDGLLVPRFLHYLLPNKAGDLQIHSTVHLVDLNLRPNLTTSDFNRK
jgi:hypothetical protein